MLTGPSGGVIIDPINNAPDGATQMWTRTGKKTEAEKITVTCYDWNGSLFFQGQFNTVTEANASGEDAERRMTLKMLAAEQPTGTEFANLTDDELLAELNK